VAEELGLRFLVTDVVGRDDPTEMFGETQPLELSALVRAELVGGNPEVVAGGKVRNRDGRIGVNLDPRQQRGPIDLFELGRQAVVG